jgi:hydrogenase nickel incorporation protein HypA/HybF
LHEYSLVQALLERVHREVAAHHGTKVRRLWLRVGELSGVEVDLLRTAYELCREKTLCEDADLEIRREDAHWTCPDCGVDVRRGERLVCARCGAPARLISGDEIMLDRIEMEVA